MASGAPAPEAWFYHLERASTAEVLPDLLGKTLAHGWRALVVSPDPAALDALDEHLWTWRDDSFLPHGRAGGPLDHAQPILLCERVEPVNAAQALFVLLDGADEATSAAPDSLAELAGFARVIVLFEARSEGALAQARRLWTRWRDSGAERVYWRQGQSGGWTRQTPA